jgi:mono/diheme cytochrome c family protein
MKNVVPALLGATLFLGVPSAMAVDLPAPAERVVDYHKDIAPIFEERCIKCHGEKKQKSDYRLDSRDDAISSGSEGAAITPGNSAESLLVRLLLGADDNYDIMPPKGDPLTPEQIGLIRAWIDQGVVWEGSAAGTTEAMAEKNDKVAFAGLGESWFVEATAQKGPLATWQIVDEKGPEGETAIALTKPNHTDAGTYNLLWDTKTQFKNGEIAVSLKSISGEEDQGGGLIWRAKDKNNYYVARFNPLEKNLRLYQVKDGKREKLASADVERAADQWSNLVVKQQDNAVSVTLNGQTLIKADVETFTEAGGIGLWTKADAATIFTQPKVSM